MEPLAVVEAVGVLFGVIGVWLTIRQNVWCWPAGIVNVTLFLAVFFQARLYGAMALQAVYLVLSLYGWYAWRNGGGERSPLTVCSIPRHWLGALLAAGAAGGVILGLFLDYRTDAALPYWDAGTTAFSLVAQGMTTRKWVENWIVWIAVDLVSVGMFLYQGLYPTAGLYFIFLIMAMLGFREWKKTSRSGPVTRERS